MPTYVVTSRTGALTTSAAAELARRITATHAAATGAPHSFCQVLHTEVDQGAHFIGGQPADPATVWVHGHLRAGRCPDVLARLQTGLVDDVVAVTGVDAEHVWVYLSPLAPAHMVEFGRVLPEPGQEEPWVAALPPALRRRLTDLDETR